MMLFFDGQGLVGWLAGWWACRDTQWTKIEDDT